MGDRLLGRRLRRDPRGGREGLSSGGAPQVHSARRASVDLAMFCPGVGVVLAAGPGAPAPGRRPFAFANSAPPYSPRPHAASAQPSGGGTG